jgi:hypothetical protein
MFEVVVSVRFARSVKESSFVNSSIHSQGSSMIHSQVRFSWVQSQVIPRSSFVTVEKKTLVVQWGRERVRDSHWWWAVIIGCNCNLSDNKSKHPIQNPLLFVTETRTHDSIYLYSCNVVLSEDYGAVLCPVYCPQTNQDGMNMFPKTVPSFSSSVYIFPLIRMLN